MKKLLSIIIVTIVLSGCGIQKLAEDTKDSVNNTNTKLDVSNEKQTQLLEQTKEMSANTQKMTAAVHLQVLTVAMQQMIAPENTESLTPPARMLPFAETFAKEATTQELLEVFHTFLVDVQYGGTTTKEKPNDKDLRIHSRRVSLTAASAIAAFTSDAKMAAILKEQIDEGGRYEDTAYVFALCRYTFIKDFLFGSVVSKSDRVNMDSVRKAAIYFDQMKAIAKLPYPDRLKLHASSMIVITDPVGNTQTFQDLDQILDPKEWISQGRTAIRRFERDPKLKEALNKTPEGQALLKKFKE